MDQIQLPAKFLNLIPGPGSSGFPDQKKISSVCFLEKLFKIFLIGWAGLEAGRGLKYHYPCLQGYSYVPRTVPGPSHFIRRLERPAVVKPFHRPGEGQAPMGGTPRFMGNQLPSFQGELKVRWGLRPPSPCGLRIRWLIEGLLHFHNLKALIILAPGFGKPATANFYIHGLLISFLIFQPTVF